LGGERLRGVRLGQMERWVLLQAAHPAAHQGLVLDEPDRSAREQHRRAAKKLARISLLEIERMKIYTRARDLRRENLLYRHRRFWFYADPTRARPVQRNVVWLSCPAHGRCERD
jgi:hypothetical protein